MEKIRQQLIQEFSVLDNNKDGYVTIDEILHFLESRVSDRNAALLNLNLGILNCL